MTVPTQSFDVAVLGAGPAGSSAALELNRCGIEHVLLAESDHFRQERIGESIPPDTRKLLESLSLMSCFDEEEHEPCLGSCSSWGADELGYNDYISNLYGSGWHLDRKRFDSFLAHQAAERGVSLRKGWRFVSAVKGHNGRYRLGFRTGDHRREVDAQFVIDATGRQARFARRIGARLEVCDTLICVAGSFRLADDAPLSRLTMLEACSYGWWYAARLTNQRAVVAVTTDPQIYKQRSLSKPDTWQRHLDDTTHIKACLERSHFSLDSLHTYPALSSYLNKVCGDDWIAVGDAASSYDPIASQGIHKALASGISAGGAVANKLRGKIDDFSGYSASIRRGFENFLAIRDYLYSREQRWADDPFWQRRRSQAVLLHPKRLIF